MAVAILVCWNTEHGTLREQILKLSRSQAPVYISVSGSGKVVARLIPHNGPRSLILSRLTAARFPLVVESDFFEITSRQLYRRLRSKEGLFRPPTAAPCSLDEVADLPLNMQVKLLRAIQEKAIRQIGFQSGELPWMCAYSARPPRQPRQSLQSTFAAIFFLSH
jgi:two-component system response regulator PilR (NtrC family)